MQGLSLTETTNEGRIQLLRIGMDSNNTGSITSGKVDYVSASLSRLGSAIGIKEDRHIQSIEDEQKAPEGSRRGSNATACATITKSVEIFSAISRSLNDGSPIEKERLHSYRDQLREIDLALQRLEDDAELRLRNRSRLQTDSTRIV